MVYKKWTGTLKKRFFSARMMNPWNELDEETTDVGMADNFQRKLGEYGH